ncbi:MAG: hypothetical protein JNM59_11020 [Hyphomonadaceae bacterium]|nr:hypothetical protein [Hyphomonadaceae bacterium]
MLLAWVGVVGAVACVGMYAAVSLGTISADKPLFFAVNGAGAVLVLVSAAQEFDWGDAGTVGQEVVWAGISLTGATRAWIREGGPAKFAAWRRRASWSLAMRLCAAASEFSRLRRVSGWLRDRG